MADKWPLNRRIGGKRKSVAACTYERAENSTYVDMRTEKVLPQMEIYRSLNVVKINHNRARYVWTRAYAFILSIVTNTTLYQRQR